MKKFKGVIALLIMVLIPFQSVSAAGDKTIDAYIPMDIDETYWAFEEIDQFINADIINGYMDEDMMMYAKPENKVTRAQFVKILVNALELKGEKSGKTFTDVKPTDWHYEYVNIASSLGIINGKDNGTFAPNDNITRDQMTKMIVLAFEKTVQFPTDIKGTFTDVSSEYWAYEYVNKAAANGIVKGYDTIFKPRQLATRAQAIVMIHRAIQQEQSNVSQDDEIVRFLKDHITRENALVEAGDFTELEALYKENTIGYYSVTGIDTMGADFPAEEGEELIITVDDTNLALEVLEKSDRFAKVEVTGMTAKFDFKSKNMNLDFTMSLDGEYHLKKESSTGKWKIYNYVLFEEE